MIKAILADDEKKVVFLLQRLIDWEQLGFEIVGIANDGIRALELVEEADADLLVTDIRMPGADGIELIRRAKEKNPGLHVIIISGYREFEYAQSALKYGVEDYLLKPLKKDELNNILLRIREKIEEDTQKEYRQKKDVEKRQEMMLTQLRGNANHEEIRLTRSQLNDEYGFRFVEGVYYAALIKPGIAEGWKQPEGYRIVMQHTLEIVRRELPAISEEFAVSMFPEGVAAVINSKAYNPVEVKQCFTRIRKEIEKQRDLFWNIRATVVIGSRKPCAEELTESVREAIWLCKDRICHEQMWRDAGVEQPDYHTRYQMEASQKKRFQEAAEFLSREKIAQELEESYQDLLHADRLNGQMVEDWFEDVLRACLSGMEQSGDSGQRFVEKLRELLWYCSCLQDIRQLLEQMLVQKIQQLEEEKALQESRPIMLAKKYMQEHFQEELRLEDVSSYVGFNTTYLSSLFKKETGKNFTDYLTELRVAKAKELLCAEELSVQDVCERVGYRDIKYFSRLFKRSAGISPSDYRKLYR
ncbi:MAG: response regulator [Eubacterium sp.]|nr:response regulator [Eubacterium sp.]